MDFRILIGETGFRGSFRKISAPFALTSRFLRKRPFGETPELRSMIQPVTP
jgi:hypothetical protein